MIVSLWSLLYRHTTFAITFTPRLLFYTNTITQYTSLCSLRQCPWHSINCACSLSYTAMLWGVRYPYLTYTAMDLYKSDHKEVCSDWKCTTVCLVPATPLLTIKMQSSSVNVTVCSHKLHSSTTKSHNLSHIYICWAISSCSRYKLLAFSSSVRVWPLTDKREAECFPQTALEWVNSLTASGSTCTRDTLKVDQLPFP